jgi:hypothetical protein
MLSTESTARFAKQQVVFRGPFNLKTTGFVFGVASNVMRNKRGGNRLPGEPSMDVFSSRARGRCPFAGTQLHELHA